jgi:hypothetical protein
MSAGTWTTIQLSSAAVATVFFPRLYFAMTARMGAIGRVVLIRQVVFCPCHNLLPEKFLMTKTDVSSPNLLIAGDVHYIDA